MFKSFKVGDIVTVFSEWKDSVTKAPVNPANVTLLIRRPDNTEYTLTYGVDAEITNPQTGRFTYPLELAQSGTYHWRWTATNSATSKRVLEGSLDAATSVM